MGFTDGVKKVGLTAVTGGASALLEHRAQQKLLGTGTPARAVVKDFFGSTGTKRKAPRAGGARR
jgi:hypothetical protein